MTNAKGKYIGEPTSTIHVLPGTPEEVARNRRNFEKALERLESSVAGRPVKVKVLWPD